MATETTNTTASSTTTAATSAATKKTAAKKAETKFSKVDIVSSEKYSHYSDMLRALLDEGSTYSISEVDAILAGFLAKKGVHN